jgi:putative long chain acyl-CoA synthase
MATAFDPETFWEEARRYGVTVASYTWTLLAELSGAPPNPAERDHAIRLFIGSGMPRGVWRRVEQRFAPARVLEFYASTHADIVLVNLSGRKRGALGRPLPGGALLRIARYDAENRRLQEGPGGLAVECETGETGMLLAQLGDARPSGARALRGVFEPGDTWLESGDLFLRDEEGDFWLAGPVSDLIPTAEGPVAPRPIEHALGELPGVILAVAYGVPVGDDRELAAAAVTLEPGKVLVPAELDAALAVLAPAERPAIVRVVDQIDVTASFRPLTSELRREGVPAPDDAYVFQREASGQYSPLADPALTGAVKAAQPVHH